MKKALILFGAGKESIYSLHKLVEDFGPENVTMMLFDYGQASFIAETRSAEYYGKKLGVYFFNQKVEIQLPTAIEVGAVGDTEVPYRNGVFLSLAVNYALTNDIGFISLGVTDTGDYGDGSREFVEDMDPLLQRMFNIKLISPTRHLTGFDVAIEIVKNGMDDSHLWSCMTSDEKHCGKCSKCLTIMGEYINLRTELDPKLSIYMERHYGLRTVK